MQNKSYDAFVVVVAVEVVAPVEAVRVVAAEFLLPVVDFLLVVVRVVRAVADRVSSVFFIVRDHPSFRLIFSLQGVARRRRHLQVDRVFSAAAAVLRRVREPVVYSVEVSVDIPMLLGRSNSSRYSRQRLLVVEWNRLERQSNLQSQ